MISDYSAVDSVAAQNKKMLTSLRLDEGTASLFIGTIASAA